MSENQLPGQPGPEIRPWDPSGAQKPSVILALLAAAMPLVFVFCLLIISAISIATLGSERIDLAQIWDSVPGLTKLALLAAIVVGVGGCSLLLALAGLGRRVPAVALLILAALPWIAGSVCSALAERSILEAMQAASGAGIAAVAAGLSEALLCRLAGSLLAAVLLWACGLGLGLAAIGQRAKGKRIALIFLLLASALPLFIFTTWWTFHAGLGASGFLPILIAVGGALVAILAGVAVPAPSSNTRNWPLAVAAGAASFLAFTAAAAFCSSWNIVQVFADVAVSQSGAATALSEALKSVSRAGVTLLLVGGALALLPALVLAAISIVKTKVTGGWVAGAVTCVVLAFGGTLLLDQITSRGVSSIVQLVSSEQPPLASTETPPAGALDSSEPGFLIAPPPAPPPPPRAATSAETNEAVGGAEGDVFGGIVGGVPGGVEGGVPGGVLGGVVGGVEDERAKSGARPAARKATPSEPIRIGGSILMAKVVSKVTPTYPELAKMARVQGAVTLDTTVDETGKVSDIKLVRGHPILTQAAIDAVSKWEFQPTLLNGEPVSVRGMITINFTLEATGR